jgi:hypothetical protein
VTKHYRKLPLLFSPVESEKDKKPKHRYNRDEMPLRPWQNANRQETSFLFLFSIEMDKNLTFSTNLNVNYIVLSPFNSFPSSELHIYL